MIRFIAAAAVASVLLPMGAASAQAHDPVGKVYSNRHVNYGSVVTVTTTAVSPQSAQSNLMQAIDSTQTTLAADEKILLDGGHLTVAQMDLWIKSMNTIRSLAQIATSAHVAPAVSTTTVAASGPTYKIARRTVCTEITYRLTNASTSPLPISFQLVDLATGLKSAWVTAFPGFSATASLTPAHRVVAFDKIGNGPVRYAPATTYPTLGCS
jgi:hypothetical protein